MTSTEFAAKYRLLKNVATRGARSFLAQQVELGRMVMVHYLDAENAGERAATVARLNALPSGSRGKLTEIAEVDGTPVAVTLFISSFKDFETWLDSVSPPTSAPTAAPEVAPASKPEAPKKTPGEFTRIFAKVDESSVAPSTLPPIAMGVTPTRNEDAIPTVIMEAVKPPKAASPPKPEPPPPEDSGSSFTAIFGSLRDSPHAPDDLPAPSPLSLPPAASAPLMPPAPPPLDFRPRSPSPAPQAPEASQPGEFTQLFQRLSPSGGVQSPSPLAGAASFLAPEVPRPIEPLPRADAAPPSAPSSGAPSLGLPPLAVPALGGPTLGAQLGMPSLGAAPPSTPNSPETAPPRDVNGLPPMMSLTPPPLAGAAAAPRSWGTPATPPPIGASVFGNSGPSEFTRMLSPIAPPPPPPVSIQPPGPAAAPAAAGAAKKSMLPLIVALATVVVITIMIVGYFVMRGAKG